MGGRYYITGVQLGMLSFYSEQKRLDEANARESLTQIQLILQTIMENQYIGKDPTGDSMKVILIPKEENLEHEHKTE